MIKVIIADDEQHALDRIKKLLSEYAEFQIAGEAKSGTEALEMIIALEPEVAFLDINMPGVDLFRSLSRLRNPPLICFQTAYSKFAAEAFDINAVDFLTKPVERERFSQAIGKILEKLSLQTSSAAKPQARPQEVEAIPVREGASLKLIPIGEILFFQFEEGLSFCHSQSGRYLVDRSLNHYEEKLTPFGFFRTNRDSLVNLRHAAKIYNGIKGSSYLELKNGTRIEVSRRKAVALKQRLLL